jgi:hypothetical protein
MLKHSRPRPMRRSMPRPAKRKWIALCVLAATALPGCVSGVSVVAVRGCPVETEAQALAVSRLSPPTHNQWVHAPALLELIDEYEAVCCRVEASAGRDTMGCSDADLE